MKNSLQIALAQHNYLLGDIEGNTRKIIDTILSYQKVVDLIVFPELALTGYPPEDLLFRDELHQRVEKGLQSIASKVSECHIIVGHPSRRQNKLYNTATVINPQGIVTDYHKQQLPNYSVFDEKRYFNPGTTLQMLEIKGVNLAICICEDIWHPGLASRAYQAGAEAIMCLNASPFHQSKFEQRLKVLRERQTNEAPIPIVYTNCVGGQDELIFDGQSFVLDAKGNVIAKAKAFEEECLVSSLAPSDSKPPTQAKMNAHEDALIYQALILGTRDYINKNNFKGALIGLSGGIDSALTLSIAVDAIGAERVHAVMMPSRYTAKMSIDDARKQAQTMGVKFSSISIEAPFESFLKGLAPEFKNLPVDTTEENLQARCRGTLLMALSNKTGYLVLTTSNKSEMAVGYSTLYGDMAGGFAPLKDVLKTQAYRLARYRNSVQAVIPENVILRPPSAELAHDQLDQDSLPDYNVLDGIIEAYMKQNKSIEEIISLGFTREDVEKTIRLLDFNEYKRRQGAPGIRVSSRAFGRDWRYPITSGFYQYRKK